VHVLAPHAQLGQKPLSFLERAGIEPRFDFDVQGVFERSRLSSD
jgi:hypothetical protein